MLRCDSRCSGEGRNPIRARRRRVVVLAQAVTVLGRLEGSSRGADSAGRAAGRTAAASEGPAE
eukprot:7041549-Alexandrium_andersonii.AAC.1